jgi:hypothetical protein
VPHLLRRTPLFHRLIATSALAVAVASIACVLSPADAATASARNAASPTTDAAHRGLYGQQDPTYDGVYRQSLSMIALHTAHARIAPAATQWLLGQQCGNGRWTSFRADLTAACGPGDSNATALAVIALHAIGRMAPARDGLAWLRRQQLASGGWEYSSGWGADSNSTGLVVQAFLAMGRHPGGVRSHGRSGLDFLRSLQVGCTAPADQQGALDYQLESPLAPNNFATAQAAQAFQRVTLPVEPAASWTSVSTPDCTGGTLGIRAQEAVTSYLAGVLNANGGAIPSAFGSGDDIGATANAVLSLVAAGTARAKVKAAMATVETQARSFAGRQRKIVPGAAALIALAEHATRGNPREVSGLNLIAGIRASITR